jgi:hypothetical protein
LHSEARLSETEKKAVCSWVEGKTLKQKTTDTR